MKHVRQRRGYDCGVAAIATLARISYAKACRAVFPDGAPISDSGWATRYYQIVAALERLGFQAVPITARRKRPLRQVLTSDAILQTQRRPDGWHWMVYNHKRRVVLDPDKDAAEATRSSFRGVRVGGLILMTRQKNRSGAKKRVS